MDRASVAPSEADSVGTGISAQNNRKVFLGKGGVAGHLTRPHANSSLGTASALDTNDLSFFKHFLCLASIIDFLEQERMVTQFAKKYADVSQCPKTPEMEGSVVIHCPEETIQADALMLLKVIAYNQEVQPLETNRLDEFTITLFHQALTFFTFHSPCPKVLVELTTSIQSVLYFEPEMMEEIISLYGVRGGQVSAHGSLLPIPPIRETEDFKKAFKILQAFETRYKKLVAKFKSDTAIAKVVEAKKRERELLEPEPEPEPKDEPEPKKPKQVAQGDGSTPPPVPLPGGKPVRTRVGKGNKQALLFAESRRKKEEEH